MSDPRLPATPVAVEEDTEHVLVRADGEIRRHNHLIYSAEDVERIRLGYCCLNCGESQVGQSVCPMPERCWVCGFEMAARQSERFATEFKGTTRVGPSTTIDEELAIAEEVVARKRRESLISVPQIILPRGI